MKRRLFRDMKLSLKIFLLVMIVNVCSVAAYTAYTYQLQKETIMGDIDDRLIACAQGASFFADDFHLRLEQKDSISEQEYQSSLDKLSDFALKTKVKYVYTVISNNEKVIFTTSSYTPEEKASGDFTKLFDPYDDASDGLKAALSDRKIHFEEYVDQWGSFRSVFLPAGSAGNPYVIGVDIELSEIQAILRSSLINCLIIGLVIFLGGTVLAVLLTRAVNRKFQRLAGQLNRVAQGDLTVRFDENVRDELGVLASDLNRMVLSFNKMIREIMTSAGNVLTAVESLETSAAKTSRGAENQAARANQMATATEELTETMTSIAANTATVSKSSGEAVSVAASGKETADIAVSAVGSIATATAGLTRMIERLDSSVMEIGEISTVIEDIADQTNLLALNAAIEAARAGDMGRGFAVVADEVRTLAERTIKATKEIAVKINAVMSESKQTALSMEDTAAKVQSASGHIAGLGGCLETIVTAVRTVLDQTTQIATAVEQQSATSGEVAANVEKTSLIAREIEDMSGMVMQEVLGLIHVAERLRDSTAEFTV